MRKLSEAVWVALFVCGCSAKTPAKQEFPPSVAGFNLIDDVTETNGRTSAAYALMTGEGPVSVTVTTGQPRSASMLPALDQGRDKVAVADGLIRAADAQVKRFYPAARVPEATPALLVQHDALQQGRMEMFEFDDLFGGIQQPVRLTVYAFCCGPSGNAYEYRFRQAAETNAGPQIAAFLRALPWQ